MKKMSLIRLNNIEFVNRELTLEIYQLKQNNLFLRSLKCIQRQDKAYIFT